EARNDGERPSAPPYIVIARSRVSGDEAIGSCDQELEYFPTTGESAQKSPTFVGPFILAGFTSAPAEQSAQGTCDRSERVAHYRHGGDNACCRLQHPARRATRSRSAEEITQNRGGTKRLLRGCCGTSDSVAQTAQKRTQGRHGRLQRARKRRGLASRDNAEQTCSGISNGTQRRLGHRHQIAQSTAIPTAKRIVRAHKIADEINADQIGNQAARPSHTKRRGARETLRQRIEGKRSSRQRRRQRLCE